MLKGINGATGVMDDVLTATPMKEHGGIQSKVVERATSYHLKPTFNKCHIHQSDFPYVGHLITADQEKPEALRNMTPGLMIMHCIGQWMLKSKIWSEIVASVLKSQTDFPGNHL